MMSVEKAVPRKFSFYSFALLLLPVLFLLSCEGELPPNAPTGLTAVGVSASQINLSWNVPSGDIEAASYGIYRDGVLIQSGITSVSYSDGRLRPESEYCYAISAFNASGNESNQSAESCAVTYSDTGRPTEPTGLVANVIGYSRIDLLWGESTDDGVVAGYNIYRDGIYLKTSVTNLASDTGLDPESEHCYSVSAYDLATPPNESAPSTAVCNITSAFPAPDGLNADALSSDQINLTWASSAIGNVAGYKVYRDDDNYVEPIALVNTTSYSDTGLSALTWYCYKVSVYDNEGIESAQSVKKACATTLAPPDTTPPTEPTGLTVVPFSSTRMDLSWTDSTDDIGVTGYRIYRDGTFIQVTNSPSFSDTGLGGLTAYCYRVSAYDEAGNESAQSVQECATTLAPPDTTPPTEPTGLTATAVSSSQIDLSWTASTDDTGVTGYRVYRDGAFIQVTNSTSFSDTALVALTAYCYTVSAYDEAGNESLKSTSACETTLAPPDETLPTGSVTINSGDTYTNSASVTLTLSAQDDSGSVAEMQFSNDSTNWSTPEAYAAFRDWLLPSDEGAKTVYARFKDEAGNWSTIYNATIVLDTVAPTGSITINSGASYTNITSVTVTLSASDTNGVTEMQFSDDNTSWSTPEAYATSKAWTLPSGDGTKTVYVKFKDSAGNWSEAYSDAITLDTTAATGSITIDSGDTYTNSTSVTLTLSASDTNGVAEMQFSDDNTTWSTSEAYAVSKAWTLPSGDGTKTVYVKFKDNAGNWSEAYSDAIVLDTAAPTGSVTINSGASYTNSISVTLTLSAQDDSGSVAEMQFSDDNTSWSTPEAYATSKVWTLSSGDGAKVVYVKFKDSAGNWSVTYSDAIVLDTVALTGSITVNSGDTYTNSISVTLSLSADADEMQFSDDNTSWSTPEAYATSKDWTLQSGDGTKTVYVKFKDSAGNWSDAYSDTIILDTTAPTGSVTIDSGDTYTNSTSVTLTISASDTNGVAEMQFSDDNITWSTSEAYAVSKGWTLPSGDGTKTVYVKFKDSAGNWSDAYNDTIVLDTTAATGSITIDSGDTYTNSTSVTLTLSASDTNGVAEMQFSDDNTSWSTPEAYAVSKSWTLPLGDGTKTVYVRFKDNAGNWSDTYSDAIVLDTVAPTGTITINLGDTYTNNASVTLSLSADAAEMKFSDDSTIWSTPEAYAVSKSWTLPSGDGTKTVYVKFKDSAGNWSDAYSDTIVFDTTAPDGSITINSGDTYTTSTSVTLTLSAPDAAEMKFSDDNTNWSTPEAYATSKSWTLPAGDGTKTVYVKFKDSAGNWSDAYSDTITLDAAVPTGSITINLGDTYTNSISVTLTLSADAVEMQFSDDNTNWSISEAYATSKSWTLPSGDGTKTVYVKFKDSAGNWSDAYSDAIVLDTTAPTGSIAVNSGDTYTDSPSVTLTLSADAAEMKFSNDNTNWSTPETYATSKSWTLSSGEGTKTVYVKFEDSAGNWSDTYSDTIVFDTTAPTGSIAINSGDTYTNSTSATLTLSASDTNSAAEMQFSDDNTTWTTPEAYATSKSWTLPSGDGTKTVYAKFKDNAGNWSDTFSDTIVLDTTAPTGSIAINSGDTYTNSMSVTLTLSAADAAEMKFSNDNTGWTTPEAYATSKSWTLLSGDGTKTIYVKFKDSAGNWSDTFSDTIVLDTTAPTGSIAINSGDTYTNSMSVTLTLSAADAAEMKFSNDNTNWSTPVAYTTSKSWTLPSGDGTKTIYVKFKDSAGNWSDAFSDTIVLDTVAPTGSIAINSGDTYTNSISVTLTLSAADAAEMKFSDDNTSWTTPEAYATSKSWTLPSGDGTKTVYVKFKDSAGNWSDTFSDTIVFDMTAPTGSIAINSGDTYTTGTSVTLTLAASDTNGMAEMQFSNDNTSWTTHEAYTTSKDWTLPSGDGTKTVYVKFKDSAGNWSDAYSDTIVLDTTAPTGSIAINSGDTYTTGTSVALALSASDATEMKFSDDNTNWSISETYATSKDWTLPSGDGTKTVYVKFKDSAGNWSDVYSDAIILDTVVPTGSITINLGDTYTNSTSVTLALSALDANGVDEMQFSDDNTTWSISEAYATSKGWTLPSGDGTKTVYVKFRDKAGHWSQVYSDTIVLDTTAPSVPTELAASAVSDTQINLSWTASTDDNGVSGYKIYRDGVHIQSVAATSFSDTGLAASISYCYNVSAYDVAGNESGQSADTCDTTLNPPDTTAPSDPTGLTAASASSTQIDLSWTASTDDKGVAGYKIYRDGTHIQSVASTSFSDTGLSASTQYCYTVSAYDEAMNESGQSDSVCSTTLEAPDTTPPSDPTGLTPSAVSDTQIDLSWTASTDDKGVTGYKIYRDGVHILSVAGTLFSDTGLSASTQYCYTVSAYDEAMNESGQSDSVCSTTLEAPDTTSPSDPVGLAAAAISSTQIDLSWTGSTDDVGVEGYRVYENGVYLTSVSSTSFSITGLDEVTQYCYRVSAYDAAGNESGQSAEACATTLDETPPSAPSGLIVNAASSTEVELSWTASTDNSGVAGYKIYRDGTYLKSVTTTSASDTGLLIATQYCYAVSAYDAAGNESGLSVEECATTKSWKITTVDSTGDVGSSLSMATDSMNNVHFGYYEYDSVALEGDLKYATNVSGSWVVNTIDSPGDVGWDVSIAVDSNNKVHISYNDYDNGDLKYATNVSGSWVVNTIDSADYVGFDTSIAIDSVNNVHISYYDATNQALKYATNASGSWETSTLDSVVGWLFTSIAIDSNNNIHISYYDSTNGDLKYATNASGLWETSTVDSTGEVGEYTSIAIDSTDNVHISYYDYTYGDLKYATNASGSWAKTTLDDSGDVGLYTSIVVDSDDKVHISYVDDTFDTLKYATNASGSWVTHTIENALNAGWDTSIAIDSGGKPHVGYYDSFYLDLMYAYPESEISDSSLWVEAGDADKSTWSFTGGYTKVVEDESAGVNYGFHLLSTRTQSGSQKVKVDFYIPSTNQPTDVYIVLKSNLAGSSFYYATWETSGRLRIWEVPSWTKIADSYPDLYNRPDDVWNTLEAQFIDGEIILKATDNAGNTKTLSATHDTPLTGEYQGFGMWAGDIGDEVRFDNVNVGH